MGAGRGGGLLMLAVLGFTGVLVAVSLAGPLRVLLLAALLVGALALVGDVLRHR